MSIAEAYKHKISIDDLYDKGIGFLHDLYITAFLKQKKAAADGKKTEVHSIEELNEILSEEV